MTASLADVQCSLNSICRFYHCRLFPCHLWQNTNCRFCLLSLKLRPYIILRHNSWTRETEVSSSLVENTNRKKIKILKMYTVTAISCLVSNVLKLRQSIPYSPTTFGISYPLKFGLNF